MSETKKTPGAEATAIGGQSPFKSQANPTTQHPVTVTNFADQSAKKKREGSASWAEFVEWLRDRPGCKNKEDAEWVKLARFGDKVSPKGSLRHNDNMLSIDGVEGDYDDQEVAPEDALGRLESHNICAVIVTTFSHTHDRPRWRVFAPLSRSHSPEDRRRLVAGLNGALGGILNRESFAKSQGFFVGGREGGEYKVLHTFGDPEEGYRIDEWDDLDHFADYGASKKPDSQAAGLANLPSNRTTGVIGAFNAKYHPGDILAKHGYEPSSSGREWLAPQSTTGHHGVKLLENADPPRVYSHHGSDLLSNEHSHDAFSLFQVLDHGDSRTDALKAAEKDTQPADDGQFLDANGMPVSWEVSPTTGQLRNTYVNTRRALLMMGITCSYDQFRDEHLIGGHAVEEYAGTFSDHATRLLATEVLRRYGFAPSEELVTRAILALAAENRFDSLLDHLNSLPEWDGVNRLDTWLRDYLGADDDDYTREVGALFLKASVARAYEAGIKFDQMLVLEGDQGVGKSRALRCLATGGSNISRSERFTDASLLKAPGGREVLEETRGAWICECAELDGMSKRDVAELKTFISRQHDQGRPAYARTDEKRPRRFVLAGTTNERRYLQDETGGRRFWPVKVGAIDVEGLARGRDQLLAEALHRYRRDGFLPVLSKAAGEIAKDLQDDRRVVEDAWVECLEQLDPLMPKTGRFAGYEVVPNEAVFSRLNLEANFRKGRNADQAKRAMEALGWVKHDGTVKISGSVCRVFYRPIPDADSEDDIGDLSEF